MTDSTEQGVRGGLYAALWRLHFFAGLIVLPVLLLMAATGGLYLFKAEIDGLLYGRLNRAPVSEARLPPSAWVAAAEAESGGQAARLTLPAPGGSAAVLVRMPDGGERLLHLDPADARLIGENPPGGSLGWVKRLHSLETFGPRANLLAEIAAGWAIVLVVTGLLLWWPRAGRPALALRGNPARRTFWRDLHTLFGVFAGAVILFLAVTGMPWSAVWGQQVRAITNEAGWGRPPAPPTAGGWRPAAAAEARSHVHSASPWALQGEALALEPRAKADFADMIDQVAAAASARMAPPFDLTLSREGDLAWAASRPTGGRVEDTRTLYLAPDGAMLADIAYGDFGPAAQTIEWGIAVHQGQQFGWPNKLVMLAGCLAIWGLAISGLAMWWKRRPARRLAAPPRPPSLRAYAAAALIVLPLALLYPLVGATLAGALTIDILLLRLVRRHRPADGAHA